MNNFRFLFFILTFTFNFFSQENSPIAPVTNSHFNNASNKSKLIENKGQWPKGVLFQANLNGTAKKNDLSFTRLLLDDKGSCSPRY